jgi:outer membrane protein assembly factor BamB
MHIRQRSIGLILLITFVATVSSAQAQWPQWRGPDRIGTVAEANWPDEVSDATLKELWRVDLAPGYPGPIVADGKVFTFASRDAKDEVVRAFDAKTGEPMWETAWQGAMRVPFFAKRNGSWVKSTPATDGERVYAVGMLDELVCLDAADGEIVWRVDFKERFGTQGPSFGQPCSPLIDGESLYIQAGMSVCKLDKTTGETKWRVLVDERQMVGGAFSSPVIASIAGKRQLLVQTRGELCGVDLDSGDVLWRQSIKAFRGMNILPPTVVNETDVFTSSYGGGCFMLRITPTDEGGFDVATVWTNKIEGYMSSPLLIDGHLYMHGRDKKFHCINAETGETAWSSDETYGEYWSSVRSGNRILALGDNGVLRLIDANPDQLDIVSEHKVSTQETWGHLAIVGDVLFIRELEGLKTLRWSNQAAARVE